MTEELYVSNRDDWRAWLMKNHGSKKEVWLVYYKKHTGKSSIPYDDSVGEALCFGWVDSIIRKIDAEKYARKFTPRTGKSRWSEANKKRVEKMIKEGKMTEAGVASVKNAKECGQWFTTSVPAKELAIPSYLKEALARNRKALDNFDRLADGYKKLLVRWIDSAKREETRKRRIVEAIELLERNQKLGMK